MPISTALLNTTTSQSIARPPVAARTTAAPPLLLSDYVFLAGATWSALLCIDPLKVNADPNSTLKHLTIALMVAGLALTLAANLITRFDNRAWARWLDIAHAAWPLVAVSAVILGGSLYARFAFGIEHTFMNVGLYMTVTFWTALMVCASRAGIGLVRAYFWVWGGFATAIVVWFLFSLGGQFFNFHELEYVCISLAVFFAVGTTEMKPWVRYVGLLFFLSLTVLFHKNTGYLVGVVTLGYLCFMVWLPRIRRLDLRRRLLFGYLTLLALALATTLIALVLAFREQLLPTGNPEFRSYTYARAWALFLESPLWGNLWVTPAVSKFPLFDTGIANNMLPTHSDILDILANGGLIGLTLFVWGCARVARYAYKRVLSPKLEPTQWTPYAHALACCCLSAIPVIAFNPVLLRPSRTAFLWISLGMLLAIAMLSSTNSAGGPAKQVKE